MTELRYHKECDVCGGWMTKVNLSLEPGEPQQLVWYCEDCSAAEPVKE